MAKGWNQVEQATAAAAEARERAQQNSKPQLFTSHVDPAKGGQPVRVRFLEQGADVNSFERHEYQVPDKRGGFWRRQFTCLREVGLACPGCQVGLKLKTRGVYNVIQRNRAVLRQGQDKRAIKGPDGKYIVDGYADAVVILDVPSTTAEALRQKDGSYHGLMSRDLVLSMSGNSFQPWNIEPADIDAGATPLSENDQALMAQKHNIDEFMKPPTPEETLQIIRQHGANSGADMSKIGMSAPGPVAGGAPPQGNAMAAGAGNGFLQGAAVPAGAGGVPSPAFGAAQAAILGAAPPAPAATAAPVPAQPGVPGATVPATGAAAIPPVQPQVQAQQPPAAVQQPPTPPPAQPEPGVGQPQVPVAPPGPQQ